MIIKYKSSNGKSFDLVGKMMRVTEGSFHDYEWKISASKLKIGERVNEFTKEPAIYNLTITLRGEDSERKKMLNELRNAFEHDVATRTPGRITFGDYHIDCYIIKSKTGISQITPRWIQDEVSVYCPYPEWIQDAKKELLPSSGDERASDYLDYPYDFPYDYTASEVGVENWYIDHYTDSNFDMIIYGPCTNPRIVINSHVYQVNDTLAAGEHIVVDSREKTVVKHLNNGTTQNIFNRRNKKSSIFEKIPAGDNVITWSGEYGVDIIAHIERSEPEWI